MEDVIGLMDSGSAKKLEEPHVLVRGRAVSNVARSIGRLGLVLGVLCLIPAALFYSIETSNYFYYGTSTEHWVIGPALTVLAAMIYWAASTVARIVERFSTSRKSISETALQVVSQSGDTTALHTPLAERDKNV